eukprot:9469167-Pyramimonas_sp.AAC.1
MSHLCEGGGGVLQAREAEVLVHELQQFVVGVADLGDARDGAPLHLAARGGHRVRRRRRRRAARAHLPGIQK